MYKQIEKDIKVAMIEKNVLKRNILRVVKGEFDRTGKDISDIKAIAIIRKMHNNAIEFNNDEEAEILGEYLPKMLEPKEIRIIVSNIIDVNGYTSMKDMGQIMSKLKQSKEFPLLDMSTASIIIKELLV